MSITSAPVAALHSVIDQCSHWLGRILLAPSIIDCFYAVPIDRITSPDIWLREYSALHAFCPDAMSRKNVKVRHLEVVGLAIELIASNTHASRAEGVHVLASTT